jgi:hypothetical protein
VLLGVWQLSCSLVAGAVYLTCRPDGIDAKKFVNLRGRQPDVPLAYCPRSEELITTRDEDLLQLSIQRDMLAKEERFDERLKQTAHYAAQYAGASENWLCGPIEQAFCHCQIEGYDIGASSFAAR